MNYIDKMAAYFTQSIRFHYKGAGSEIALKYALGLVINTAISIAFSLSISTIAGHFLQCLIGIISFTFIRILTGGLHASSSLACCLLSITIFLTITFAPIEDSTISIFINLLSINIFYFTAPNGIQNISSINPKFYPLLKITAILLVASNFITHSAVLTTAFFIQACLTTKPAYVIKNILERKYLS